MPAFVVFFVILFFIMWFKMYRDYKNFPPGPFRVPGFGSLIGQRFRVGSRLLLDSVELIPKYGDIIGYVIGPRLKAVFVQSFQKAKEFVNDDNFQGRFSHSVYVREIRGYGRVNGVAMNEGYPWKLMRRFSLTSLKEFGFGKKSMETIIQEEAMEIVHDLSAQTNTDIIIEQTFNVFIVNVLWRIVANHRYKQTDPQVTGLLDGLHQMFKYAFVEYMFPAFTPEALNSLGHKRKYMTKMKRMLEEIVREHKQTREPGQPRDFIDMYLDEQEKDSCDLSAFAMDNLIGLLLDFFEAGGETVGTTLSWVMLYLAINPEVQKKCHEELDRVLGVRSATLDDKPQLRYCEATIMEVQRLSCVAPAGIGHRPFQKTNFHGYTIDTYTMVYYNIYRFHTDPDYWDRPLEFRPERFLDDSGNIIKHEQFVPFGFGKRVCMGENLAKLELFVFFTALLRNFHVGLPKQHPVPNPGDDVCGFTRSPKPFAVFLTKRNEE